MGRTSRERSEKRNKKRWRWIAAGIAALVLAAGGVGLWQWNGAPAALEPAPRFNLMGSTGTAYRLDDFLGKQEVVLIFYMGAG